MKPLISWLWQAVFIGIVMCEDNYVLRRTLGFEVEGQWKKGRPNWSWRKQIEEDCVKVCLRRGDALCRSMWSVGVNQIASWLR